jgi:hypothetical protein
VTNYISRKLLKLPRLFRRTREELLETHPDIVEDSFLLDQRGHPLSHNGEEYRPFTLNMPSPMTLTVGADGNFPTLASALEYASRFRPVPWPAQVMSRIHILAGHVISYPIYLHNLDLSAWYITSQAPSVEVTVDGFGEVFDEVAGRDEATSYRVFWHQIGGVSPALMTKLVCTMSSWTGTWNHLGPGGHRYIGAFVSQGVFRSLSQNVPSLADAVPVGFEGFSVGIEARHHSRVMVRHMRLDNNRARGLILDSGSTAFLSHVSITNVGRHPLTLLGRAYAELSVAVDCRQNGISESSDDVNLSGGILFIRNEPDIFCGYGGTHGPRFVSGGGVYDRRRTDPPVVSGAIRPAQTTLAELPSMPALPGTVVYVTDGDAGSPCLAVYSGGAWRKLALGSAL